MTIGTVFFAFMGRLNRHESEVIPIKTPVSRVGNKTSILHILYALFPLNYGRFIDVFGGSGSVLLGNPTVSSFEVYNDFDRNLANLFHCMKERTMATIRELGFCHLNSREDFIAIRRFFENEVFDDLYLSEELKLTEILFPPPEAKELMEIRTRINGQMVINETEAIVIRRIFNLYLQGFGMQAIANMLNEDGIPRRYGHTHWYSGTIKYVLTNERYMGDAVLQKKFTTETLPFRKVRNKGQLPKYYVENSNPPIVSRETYEAVQELMRSRQTSERKVNTYPLSTKLRCPECGRSFRRIVTRGTAYWTCSGRSAGATDCDNRRVREDMVYEAFTDMVLKLKANQADLLGTLIRQIEAMQDRTSRNQERIRQIDKEIADLGAKNLVITRLHTSGVLDAADYAKQTSEIGNRITDLRIERRKKLTEDEDDVLLDTLKELNGILEEYEPTAEFDNDLFEQIVQDITVNDNTQITFRLLGDIQLTEKINEKGRCKSA